MVDLFSRRAFLFACRFVAGRSFSPLLWFSMELVVFPAVVPLSLYLSHYLLRHRLAFRHFALRLQFAQGRNVLRIPVFFISS